MTFRLVSGLGACIAAALFAAHVSVADAAPSCDPETTEAGSLIYTQVVDAKPIEKGPEYGKALLPKRTMGAKLYVKPSRGMTEEYLQLAALCHAASDAPPLFQGDPLRVDGKLEAIRVHSGGSTHVLSIIAEEPATGREVWKRAQALTTDVDADVAKRRRAKTRGL